MSTLGGYRGAEYSHHVAGPAKMAETIEMPFAKLTHAGPRNHELGGSQDPTPRALFKGYSQDNDAAFCRITLDTFYS